MKKIWLGLITMGASVGIATAAQTSVSTPTSLGKPASSPAAQTSIPAAGPTGSQGNTSTGAQSVGPLAPPAAIQFPAVDAKSFTVSSPTPETVDSFLHAVWGLDENREWRVASIQPASVPGFVKVDVYVADRRQPTRVGNYTFLTTPDGKHAVQGDLAAFGAHPFAETRVTLQQRADGPARGAAGKELELVEFADLQCPSCKAAQGTMDQIVKDFPQAHVVFQDLPLSAVHPFAMQAAEVGHCVRKAKGDPAFFVYAQKVFDTQADLTAGKVENTLRAAVTAAGADPAAVMTCASAPSTKDAVEASIKLAADLGINNTPTLVVNGRIMPLSQVPYAGLKKVIVFQGQLDGIAVQEQPSLTTLK